MPLNSITREELLKAIELIKEGNEDEFEKLIDVLGPYRRCISNRYSRYFQVEREDVSQEIDLNIFLAIRNYDQERDESPMRHIVSWTNNQVWNKLYGERYYSSGYCRFMKKDETNYRTVNELDKLIDKYGLDDNIVRLEDVIMFSMVMDKILSSFSGIDREIYIRYFIEDKTQEEIAVEIGKTQSSISRRIERIKKKLCKKIAKAIGTDR